MNVYEENYYRDLCAKKNKEISDLKKELASLKNLKHYTEKGKAKFTYDNYKGYVFSVMRDRPNGESYWCPIVVHTKTREESIEKAIEIINSMMKMD